MSVQASGDEVASEPESAEVADLDDPAAEDRLPEDHRAVDDLPEDDLPEDDLPEDDLPEEVEGIDEAVALRERRAAERAARAGILTREPRPSRRVLWALVAVLGVVSVGLAVVAASATTAGDAREADRTAVRTTASTMVAALLTYDYRDFEPTRRRVLQLSTGGFRTQYEEASKSLQSALTATQAVARAEVTEVFTSEVEDSSARALVVVTIAATGLAGSRTSPNNYVDLTLVKVGDRWLVDQVTNLNLGTSAVGGASGGTSGTATSGASTGAATTAPPATTATTLKR